MSKPAQKKTSVTLEQLWKKRSSSNPAPQTNSKHVQPCENGQPSDDTSEALKTRDWETKTSTDETCSSGPANSAKAFRDELCGTKRNVVKGDYPLICFDLETTGLSIDDEIVQISACGIIDGVQRQFNQYVLPNKKMAFGASKVTGIRIRRGYMYHNRIKVQTCSTLQGLNKFLHWLKGFPKSLLVAHNAQFDSRMLIKSCVKYNLMQFGLKKAVAGFVDTLPVMKETFPGRDSYQLEGLVNDILKVRYRAHDAREDTNALLNLIRHESICSNLMLKHSFTLNHAESSFFVSTEKKKNMRSMKELVDNNVLSKGMAEKVASSGLTKDDLLSAVHSEGYEGIEKMCKENYNGKARVTKSSAVIQQLFDHLSLSDQ